MDLVECGAAPASPEVVEAIGWMLALAERVARKHGKRAIHIVRTTAQAIADLADEELARVHTRNLSLEISGLKLEPTPWMSALARFAGRVGLDVGAVALQSKLASLGIGSPRVPAPSPHAAVHAIASVLRGMTPDQLLDLAISRLRAALPAGADVPWPQAVNFHLVPMKR